MSRQAPNPGGISRKPLTDKHLEVERLWLDGKSQAEIARAIGKTSGTVARLLEKIADVRSLEKVRAV